MSPRTTGAAVLDLEEPRRIEPALVEQSDRGGGHAVGSPGLGTATAAYPYVDRDRATAGLRGQLREILAGAGAGVPDWTTLVVEGPTEVEGLHRRVWIVWTATVLPALCANRSPDAASPVKVACGEVVAALVGVEVAVPRSTPAVR